MLSWLGIEVEGFGSEGSIINFIINLVCIFLILYFFKIRPAVLAKQRKDRRKPGNPGNSKPGSAQECKDHMKDLTELKTEVNNIKDDIKEMKKNNREDHKEIFKEINKLGR